MTIHVSSHLKNIRDNSINMIPDDSKQGIGLKLQRQGVEIGSMLRRLSSQTLDLTRSFTESLNSECAVKLEPGRGISRRQSLILSRIIDPLETEQVDENSWTLEDYSEGEFIGVRLTAESDLSFRHRLSTTQSDIPAAVIFSNDELEGDFDHSMQAVAIPDQFG
jgi:hypothetical protein